MVAVDFFPKICLHGKLAVGAFRPLIYHFMGGKRQLAYLGKPHVPALPMLDHHLILAFAA